MSILDQEITDRSALYCGDSIEIMASLPRECCHVSVYSPPFGGLYCYSSDERDLSNSLDYTQFFSHYEHMVKEIERITLPGRMTAVHCMDVPSGNSGTDHLTDFQGDIIRLHVGCRRSNCKASSLEKQNGKCGHGWFDFIARYAIWKEPLAVRNRTMAKNLAHKTIVDDSSRCSVASADYLLVFRRNGKNPIPIAHPIGLDYYAGERKPPAELLRYKGWTGNQIQNKYSHWIWRQYASAFWDDIRIGRVLPFKEARDEDDEKHVHPLQLDVIERILTLWSNPGEILWTPCMGVGSEVAAAIYNGRKGFGAELKPSYYQQARRNVAEALKNGRGNEDQNYSLFAEQMDESEDESAEILAEQ